MDVMIAKMKCKPETEEDLVGLYRGIEGKLPTGNIGYYFCRSEDDPLVFSYVSFWDSKRDWEKFFSGEAMLRFKEQQHTLIDGHEDLHWYSIESASIRASARKAA